MAFEMNYSKAFIVLILLILFYLLLTKVFTSSGLTSLADAKDEQMIEAKSVSFDGTRNKSYSIWVYVDDWNHRYGSKKMIFDRVVGDSSKTGLEVSLGEHSNDIVIDVHYKDASASSSAATTVGDVIGTACTTGDSCASGYCDLSGNTCGAEPTNTSGCTHSHNSDGKEIWTCATPASPATPAASGFTNMEAFGNRVEGLTSHGDYKVHTCKIKNIPLQKFVNIIVSFNNKTLDVYFNGKLVKTCLTEQLHEIDSNANIRITPDGGFSGHTSKFKFWPYPMSPQKAWDVYSEGYTTGLGFTNFFAKYSVKLSLLENNVEESSISF